MNRRYFAGLAAATVLHHGLQPASALAATPPAPVKPFALGWVITPFGSPEEHFRTVPELGFSTCFLSLDKYIGSFTPALAAQYRDLLAKSQLTATAVEVVGPGSLEWHFTQGASHSG